MDGGMEADAMRALDKVTSIGAVVSRPAGQRAVGTDGVGDEGRRAEQYDSGVWKRKRSETGTRWTALL